MLKMTTKNKSNKSKSSTTTSFVGLAGGVFVFYIIHDAIQERLFRIEGFEFGSFMTVCELTAMSLGSLVSSCCSSNDTDGDNNGDNNGVTKSSVTASAENKKKKTTKKRRDLLPPLNVLLLNFGLVLLIALSQASGSQVNLRCFFLFMLYCLILCCLIVHVVPACYGVCAAISLLNVILLLTEPLSPAPSYSLLLH